MLENTSTKEFLYYGSRRVSIETKKRTQLKGNFVVPFSRVDFAPVVLAQDMIKVMESTLNKV